MQTVAEDERDGKGESRTDLKIAGLILLRTLALISHKKGEIRYNSSNLRYSAWRL